VIQGHELRFASDRIRTRLERIERLAAGDTQVSLPISPLHDGTSSRLQEH
jgi:hypothetical protein